VGVGRGGTAAPPRHAPPHPDPPHKGGGSSRAAPCAIAGHKIAGQQLFFPNAAAPKAQ
jgi:hypothetical protein